jgi:hypothetical protein
MPTIPFRALIGNQAHRDAKADPTRERRTPACGRALLALRFVSPRAAPTAFFTCWCAWGQSGIEAQPLSPCSRHPSAVEVLVRSVLDGLSVSCRRGGPRPRHEATACDASQVIRWLTPRMRSRSAAIAGSVPLTPTAELPRHCLSGAGPREPASRMRSPLRREMPRQGAHAAQTERRRSQPCPQARRVPDPSRIRVSRVPGEPSSSTVADVRAARRPELRHRPLRPRATPSRSHIATAARLPASSAPAGARTWCSRRLFDPYVRSTKTGRARPSAARRDVTPSAIAPRRTSARRRSSPRSSRGARGRPAPR